MAEPSTGPRKLAHNLKRNIKVSGHVMHQSLNGGNAVLHGMAS